MPVTYPVIELIARELHSRLSAMIGNPNYQTSVQSVERATRTNNPTPEHLQVTIGMGEEQVIEELSHPGNPPAIARVQTFNIRCHVLSDENSTVPITTDVTMFVADVMKAICVPQTTWHTFDNNAIDASFGAREFFQADGGLDGAIVNLDVLYRTSENDSYTVRA